MSWFKAKDLLDRTFEIGIILKGLDGILELLGGALLLAVSPATINRIVGGLTQHELSEDPGDLIATHLLRLSHGLTGSAVVSPPPTCCYTASSRSSWSPRCCATSCGPTLG